MEFMLYISWVKVTAWIKRTLVKVEEKQRCVNEHGASSSAPCVSANLLYTLGFVNFTVDSIKQIHDARRGPVAAGDMCCINQEFVEQKLRLSPDGVDTYSTAAALYP